MKTWTVKTVVGTDHQVAFKIPGDVPEGPVEIVVVVQPVVEAISLINMNWTEAQAAETLARLKSFEEDWNTPGMEGYDAI